MFHRIASPLFMLLVMAGLVFQLENPSAFGQAKDTKKEDPKKEMKKEDPKKEPKKKDGKDEFKDSWPKVNGLVAKVVQVDIEKKIADFVMADGKQLSLPITTSIKFVGPRGGKRPDGIKDNCFEAGYYVKLVYDAAGKQVTEIHLSVKKSEK